MLEGIVLALAMNLTDADGATIAPEFSDGTEISTDLLPQIRVKATPMTTLRFYNLDDETITVAIGVGDEEVEMPSYFFKPGRYAAVNTATEGGCENLNLEECRAAGLIGMATFMIGPGDEIVPVTPSPDLTEEVPAEDIPVQEEEAPQIEITEPATDIVVAAPVDNPSATELVPEEAVATQPVDEVSGGDTLSDEAVPVEVPAAEPTVDITVTDGGTIDIVAH